MEVSCLQENTEYVVSVALFKDVTNCNELRKSAMSGTLEAALIKPSIVVDKFQVLCAANKALHNNLRGKQVTKALHSEVLYCLSPSKNISDAFKKFGIADQDTSVLIVEIKKAGESKIKDIEEQVIGSVVELCSLNEAADIDLVKKTYKVNDMELTVGTLLEAVVGRMACKDFVSF